MKNLKFHLVKCRPCLLFLEFFKKKKCQTRWDTIQYDLKRIHKGKWNFWEVSISHLFYKDNVKRSFTELIHTTSPRVNYFLKIWSYKQREKKAIVDANFNVFKKPPKTHSPSPLLQSIFEQSKSGFYSAIRHIDQQLADNGGKPNGWSRKLVANTNTQYVV